MLGLKLPLEPGGPLPPLAVKFAAGAFQSAPILPPQEELPKLLDSGKTVVDRDPEWSELSYEDLAIPARTTAERSAHGSGSDLGRGQEEPAARVRGEADADRLEPRLLRVMSPSWLCPGAFRPGRCGPRQPQDRVFEESLFWVQTRSVRCNYCMGHCEMLLEVAGLDKEAVADRTRRLAGDDWSCFPPAEQRAYAYARKLTKTPWELTDGRLQDPRSRPRPRQGDGHLLVALPGSLHDPSLRRLPAPSGARKRLRRSGQRSPEAKAGNVQGVLRSASRSVPVGPRVLPAAHPD